MSGNGRVLAYTYGETSYVIEVATNEVILQYPISNHPGPVPDGYVQLLNHDGSRLLAGERPIAVWDVAAGEIVAEFHGHPGEAIGLGNFPRTARPSTRQVGRTR